MLNKKNQLLDSMKNEKMNWGTSRYSYFLWLQSLFFHFIVCRFWTFFKNYASLSKYKIFRHDNDRKSQGAGICSEFDTPARAVKVGPSLLIFPNTATLFCHRKPNQSTPTLFFLESYHFHLSIDASYDEFHWKFYFYSIL